MALEKINDKYTGDRADYRWKDYCQRALQTQLGGYAQPRHAVASRRSHPLVLKICIHAVAAEIIAACRHVDTPNGPETFRPVVRPSGWLMATRHSVWDGNREFPGALRIYDRRILFFCIPR
jgi:hypothetical protein